VIYRKEIKLKSRNLAYLALKRNGDIEASLKESPRRFCAIYGTVLKLSY